jgi:hypothetical protein
MKKPNISKNRALVLCVALCTLGPGLFAGDHQPTVIRFGVPGAGTGAFQGTIAFCISPPGVVVGFYLDESDVYHSFLRARDGTITTSMPRGGGHRFLPGHLRPEQQPGRGGHGILL